VVLNSFYTPEMHGDLLRLADELALIRGIEGIIVSDLGFILALRQRGFPKEIHVGSWGACYNSSAVDFYAGLGVHRIVLPTHLAASEMAGVMDGAEVKIDYELFVVSPLCLFADGYCGSTHCLEVSTKVLEGIEVLSTYAPNPFVHLCKRVQETIDKGMWKPQSFREGQQPPAQPRYDDRRWRSEPCSLCAVFDLARYPVRALKIPGRGENVTQIVALVRKARDFLAESRPSRWSYRRYCRELWSEGRAPCSDEQCAFAERGVGHA
jgi:collagenase-like PrtC family protease